MKKVVICGVIDYKDGSVGVVNGNNGQIQKISFGDMIEVDSFTVFPFSIPSTLDKLPTSQRYIFIEAEVQMKDKEFENLSTAGLVYYCFNNRKIKPLRIVDNRYKYIYNEILKRPKQKSGLIYETLTWMHMHGFNSISEFKYFLKIFKMKSSSYSCSLSINKSNIDYLELMIKHLILTNEDMVDLSLLYVNGEDEMSTKEVEDIVKHFGAEEKLYFVNYMQLIYGNDNLSEDFLINHVFNNSLKNIMEYNNSSNILFEFTQLIKNKSISDDYIRKTQFPFDNFFLDYAENNFFTIYMEDYEETEYYTLTGDEPEMFNEVEDEMNYIEFVVPYLTDKSLDVLKKIPLSHLTYWKELIDDNLWDLITA